MSHKVGSASFGTTGNKTVLLPVTFTPTWVRATMGARANTTESGSMFSTGFFDGTNRACHATAPGVSKRWPYVGETSYLIVGYNSSGTKVFSASMQAVPFGVGELYINVDVANSSYPVTFEYGD